MKVALIHDMLTQYGGAEEVLRVLSEIYPQAPIFTLIYNPRELGDIFSSQRIRASFLQKMPGSFQQYRWYLPLMPQATEMYDLRGFDLIISSASAFAKGVITDTNARHICYCHTPTRYLWSDSHQYVDELPYQKKIKQLIPFLFPRLRLWDRLAATRVDYFVTNSHNVQQRIKRYYGRDSQIIYPPVNLVNFAPNPNKENYFLAGGRLVPYKRFDMIINAFNKLRMPLKIFGAGPEMKRLRILAKNNITFLGFVDKTQRADLYARAQAFIHPQNEDFGITLVEAMASGTPVIAYRSGGACESMLENQTGVFFNEQTWEDLAYSVIKFKPQNYNSQTLRNRAQQFSKNIFEQKIRNFVNEKIK